MGIVKNGPIPEPANLPASPSPSNSNSNDGSDSTIANIDRVYKPGERRNEGMELVFEYCSKGDLRQFLKDPEQEISWKRRISLSLDIARGMSYLHSRNIIFRDLKARNMLLDSNNRVKIADFGLARHHTESSRPKTMCGTDGFLAPELILGMDYDHMADVFSFGMVLFEIITRQRVEKALPRGPADFFAINEEKVRVSKILPEDAPPPFLDLAFWCTRYEPIERPDFKKITVALKQLLDTVSKADLAMKRANRKSRKNAISASSEAQLDANVKSIMEKYAEYQQQVHDDTEKARLGNPEAIPVSPGRKEKQSLQSSKGTDSDPSSDKLSQLSPERAKSPEKAGTGKQKMTAKDLKAAKQAKTELRASKEMDAISPNNHAINKDPSDDIKGDEAVRKTGTSPPRRSILSGSLFQNPNAKK